MRTNSLIESATAAVAIRIGWPSRWRACSGATTARPTSMLQPPATAAAISSASASEPIGSPTPSATAAVTPPIAP